MLSGRLQAVWFFISGFPTPGAVLFLGAASLLAYRTWQPAAPTSELARWAALAVLVFGCLDWILLAALPRLGLSFGPVGLPLFGITLVRLLAVSVLAWALQRTQSGWGWPTPGQMSFIGSAALWLVNAGISACEIDALYIEPFDVRVTHLVLRKPVALCGSIRIVQISDLHVERTTKREREVLTRVEALEPDVVVLTGDYLNGSYLDDAKARQDTREFLSRLSARLGVYAVTAKRGDTLEAVEEMFEGLDIRILRDEVERLTLPGDCNLCLVGVSYLGLPRDSRVFSNLLRDVPEDAYSVLIYHTPELAGIASSAGVDLYLTGHTHGGQMRLPLFGAVFTNLRSWKKYEQGLYRVGKMTLYVNRGLGMEGRGAPRARFLCRPEIVAVDLQPDAPGQRGLLISPVASGFHPRR